jgi:membrane protease YdiL (CAAX protease family)
MDIKTSPLVQAASQAKRPTRWWMGWIVVFGVGVIVVESGAALLAGMVLGEPSASPVAGQIAEAVTFGSTLLVLGLWVTLKEQRPFRSVGFMGTRAAHRFFGGTLIGGFMLLLPVLALLATGRYENTASHETSTGSAALILPFLVWVVQSSTEEAVVRGYLLQISALQLPSWLALGISSVMFGVAHLDFHPLVLTNITLAAFFFSFVALGQGSLWMACGIHAGWNYTQGSLLGVPVSGIERDASIWALGPAQGAPEWLTGGDFGIEGGAAATVVLAIAVVISFVYYRRCEEIRQRPTLG